MRVRVGALVLCCLLLLPAASAAEGQGSFVVQGGVQASSRTAVEGSALAFLVEDATGPNRLDMTLPQARVTVYEQRYQTVAGLKLASGFTAPTWTVQAATVRLLGGGAHAGFVGFYPSPGGSIEVTATSPATSEARASSSFGTVEVATTDKPAVPHYYQEVSDPHVLTTATGGLTYAGRGAVKVNGPDIEISQAGGNTTRHDTGIHQTSATELVVRWVYIELQAPATVAMEGADGLTMATARAAFTARGVLTFTPTEGELRTEDGVYEANSTEATVTGDFNAILSPLPKNGTARLDLSGDVRPSSSFVRQPAPSLLGEEAPAWWGLGLLVGGVVVVGSAALVIHKLRPRVRPMWRRGAPKALRTSADRRQAKRLLAYDRLLARVRAGDVERNHLGAALYVVASKVAEAEEDWAAMVDFMRAARLGCPDVAEYAMREGFALFYMGETTKAAGAFNDATYHDRQNGEPWYWLARCQARGGHLDDAEATLARALGFTPELLDDVETCADFTPLRERERFQGIREAIHIRLDAEQDEKDNF